MKVLVRSARLTKETDEGIKMMRDAGLDLIIVSQDELPQRAKEADAIITNNASRSIIDSAPNLKIIARPGVGVERIDLVAATERGVYVTFCGDARTESVAEHAVSLMHATVRDLRRALAACREGKGLRDFSRDTEWDNLFEFQGKVLGVVAFGRIGRRVAEIMKAAYNMKVLAFDPYIPAEKIKELGAEPVDLETLMSQSDVVTIHLPLTQETQHMIGEKEIGLMKKTAYIINTGRGKVLDERALIKALEEKRIAGAGLDVLENEPIKLDSPLLKMSNVYLTPHMGGDSKEAQTNIWVTVARDVIDVLVNNKVPKWLVNTEVLDKKENI